MQNKHWKFSSKIYSKYHFFFLFFHETGVLYSVIFCGILLRTPEVSQTQRRTAINSAIGNSLTVIPILVYQVLLADKLDGDLTSLPYTVISIPLFMGLFALILLSFNSKGGNKCMYS